MASRSVELHRVNSTSSRTLASRAKHYEPDNFGHIRQAFGIKPLVYARAFPNDLSESDPNWRHKLKESVSEGASGSFFYRVFGNADTQFIVKQITMEEKNTLMTFLPEYLKYVTKQGGHT